MLGGKRCDSSTARAAMGVTTPAASAGRCSNRLAPELERSLYASYLKATRREECLPTAASRSPWRTRQGYTLTFVAGQTTPFLPGRSCANEFLYAAVDSI